jgi:phosphoribosyl 1,2-cyclic phosphodiesterase
MALSFAVLGSGSSGNSLLVSNGSDCVLVDAGLSGRETTRRLGEVGVDPGAIRAIVVSHEHGDHARGVAPLANDLEVPVFVTDGALAASEMRLESGGRERIEAGVPFEICGMQFTPFPVPHDAVDPIAFCIERGGVKLAVVLDLGYISNLVVERLKGCDAIVLESNHDVDLLRIGPYPWALKQRVASRNGHLSNDSVAEFLGGGFDGRARNVVLAHLSQKNNLPELALLSARRALEERAPLFSCQTRLDLAPAHAAGPMVDLGA